jgi:hypothetical protein
MFVFEGKKIECISDRLFFKIYRIDWKDKHIYLITTKTIRKLGNFELCRIVFNVCRFKQHSLTNDVPDTTCG